jgi:hypothetical protein
MPIIISAISRQKACSVSRAGIGAPQSVAEQAGWKQGQDKVEIGYIPDVKCVLVSKSSKSDDGFLVGYANTRSKTGARIACQSFCREYLQAVTILPKRHLMPVIFSDDKWRVPLFLEELPWLTEEFSKKGCEGIKNDAVGVYELLGRQNAILRVGEGKLRERLDAHLRDRLRFLPTTKAFRYFSVASKEDAELLERILIAQHEAKMGVLPPLNEIRS